MLGKICALFLDVPVTENHEINGGEVSSYLGMVKRINKYLDGAPLNGRARNLFAWYRARGEWAQYLGALSDDLLYENNPGMLSSSVAKALYGEKRASASLIESYMGCPYKFFIEYGLKIKAPREYEDRRMDIGTLMHECLDVFFRHLTEENMDISTIEDDKIEDIMSQVSGQVFKKYGFLDDIRRVSLRKKAERQLLTSIRAIRWQLKDTGVKVAMTEAKVGKQIDDCTVTLDDGSSARLTGKIDRVDILESSKSFRIVDYKSSDKQYTDEDFVLGVDMQLALYLMIVYRHYQSKGHTPEGAYYFNLKLDEDAEDSNYKSKRMWGIAANDLPLMVKFSGKDGNDHLKSVHFQLTDGGKSVNRAQQWRLNTPEQFKRMFDIIKWNVRYALTKIYEGEVPARPVKTRKKTECEYCSFKSACRFDERYEGNSYRSISKEEIVSALGREGEAQEEDE